MDHTFVLLVGAVSAFGLWLWRVYDVIVKTTVTTEVECGAPCPKHRVRPVFKWHVPREVAGPVAPTPQYYKSPLLGEVLMAAQLTATQEVVVSVEFLDGRGNPATVDGTPTWSTDNPSILALAPSPDGKSCTISAIGMLGTANVQMDADADLGAGSEPVIGTDSVEVVAGRARTVRLVFGQPTEQPTTPPTP